MLLIVEDLSSSDNFAISAIQELGHDYYSKQEEYSDYDSWVYVEIDLSAYDGKPQELTITLPDLLIQRMDKRIKENSCTYRDRSHFLAMAAVRELF